MSDHHHDVPDVDGAALAKAAATRAVTFVAPAAPGLRKALNGRVAAIFPRLAYVTGGTIGNPWVWLADAHGHHAHRLARGYSVLTIRTWGYHSTITFG